jgi:hypothetical protein
VTAPVLTNGGTVVCIATGSSLTAEDVAYVRDKAVVVAINDAWKMAPWAPVLYSSDTRWYPHYQWVPEFTGQKIAMDIKHASAITLTRTGSEGVEWEPTGLRCARHSGGAAINLAVHLGAKRVVLLGYDYGYPNGKKHFFGDHPRHLDRRQDFHIWKDAVATMAAPLKERGIEVWNCSRHTTLTAFPTAALETVL